MNATTQIQPRVDWTGVGAEYSTGDKARARILEAVSRIEWRRVPKQGEPPLSMPFMPGEAIKGLCRGCRFPNVSHVCYSHELAPLGLVGVRAHYKSGEQVELFAVDNGREVVPVCALVTLPNV